MIRLVLSATLVIGSASANDTNYQNYIVGERALGLGGAFTALADDASGAFYNPAGLALVPSSSLSASLNIYGIETQKRKRARTDTLKGQSVTVDLEDSPIATLPTTVALLRKFGKHFADGIHRHAIAFSTYLPYASEFQASATLDFGDSKGHYSISESDKTVWTGPAYAIRLNQKWSVGAALFYSFRTAKRQWEVVGEQFFDAVIGSSFLIEQESAQWTSSDLFGRAGVRFDATGRWHLGLTASSPSAHLHGTGTLASNTAVADPTIPFADYHPLSKGGLPTANKLPTSFRAGVAYQRPKRWLGALDVSLHLPTDFRPIDTGPIAELDERFQPTVSQFVTKVSRETVVNANLGGEYYLFDLMPIRGGVFTNFASSPEIVTARRAQLQHVDMYGATMSLGYAAKGYDMSLGVLYSFGRGKGAALNQDVFEPQDVHNDFIYFYISGAQKAIKKIVKKAIGKAQNNETAEASKKKG